MTFNDLLGHYFLKKILLCNMLEFIYNFIENRTRERKREMWKLRHSVRDPSTKKMLWKLGYTSKRTRHIRVSYSYHHVKSWIFRDLVCKSKKVLKYNEQSFLDTNRKQTTNRKISITLITGTLCRGMRETSGGWPMYDILMLGCTKISDTINHFQFNPVLQ